jgi:hypothetical protein
MEQQELRVIKGLLARSLSGLAADTGRIVEAVTDPVIFFVVWGLLFSSGLIDQSVAGDLLIVNLIWASCGALQKQASLSIMYDLWSREFVELFRAGVTARQYLSAMVVFGFGVGALSALVYLILAPICFGADLSKLSWILLSMPVYGMAAISISCMGIGIIYRSSQLYGFVGGVTLQIAIALSSPFVPRDDLPTWWQKITYLIPFSWVFEAVRSSSFTALVIGQIVSLIWFAIAVSFYFQSFDFAKAKGKLSRI